MRVLCGSGAVRNVAASHTTVVIATVMIMIHAKSTGLSVSNFQASCSDTETTKAEIMAETSLHALMRHQYQRSISTLPVPAPVTIRSFHAPAMESI